VLPIEVPTNFSDEGAAYWAATAAPGAPVVCTPGVTFPKVISAAVLGQFPACPNGVGSGGCSLPVNTDNPAVPNFNCFNPNAAPLATMPDGRYFNTVAVIPAGTLRVDGYCNGAIAIPCTRQGRAVTAWYRLHTTRATNQGGTNLIGNVPPAVAVNNCKTFDATTQIGCLVKANPCSIGYAGREAVDKAINGPVNNFAYKLGGGDAFAPSPLPPTDDLIYALQDLTATQFYPMSRKLFVNKYVDTTKAETVAANVAAEDALYNCFSSHTGIPGTVSGNAYNGAPLANFWVQKFNFLPILSGPIAGAGPQLDNVCPSVR